MQSTDFIEELSNRLDELMIRCHEEAEKNHELKYKVMLQTSSEILGGLKKALEDSQNLAEEELEDKHVFSPKNGEPWD